MIKVVSSASASKSASTRKTEAEDTINLLSFVTNWREPFGSYSKGDSQIDACTALILAGAEVERIYLGSFPNPGIPARLMEAIYASPTVSYIYISDLLHIDTKSQSPIFTPALRSMTSLRKLYVNERHWSRRSLNALAELLGPKSDIQVSLCLHDEPPDVIDMVRRIHSLQKLYIFRGTVTDKSFSDAMRKDWPNLRCLDLRNVYITDMQVMGNALESVACRLNTLHLRYTNLYGPGIVTIVDGLLRGYSHAPGKRGVLRKLILDGVCDDDEGGDDGNYVGEAGGIKIAQLVRANPHLKLVNIVGIQISSAGAELGKSFRICAPTLVDLRLCDRRWNTEAVISVCRSLTGAYSLSRLRICGTLEAPARATRAIARDLLASAASLDKLYILSCGIDAPAAKELAEGFAANRSLRVLDLSWNRGVGAEAANLFAAMHNLKLIKLTLLGCAIDDAGSGAVGELVALSSSLRKLELGSNRFHAKGAKVICAGVAHGGSIEDLGLAKNKIGSEGARYVAELIICGSRTMRSLDIAYIGMGVKGAKAIAKAVLCVPADAALKEVRIIEEHDAISAIHSMLVRLRKLREIASISST